MASSRGGVGGNSHISVHLGFDMCQAPTVDKLATWWSYSPYYDFGVYIGGVNMACLNANVNSSWVSTVKGQGWGLMPLWVGYQAPCSTITSVTFDTSTAATLAQQDAEDASINASDDGLSNTIIYFDLEAYTAGGTCGAAVADFISDWVADIHSYGYLAGVYFSASDAQDVLNASLQPDDIWIGHYDNRATIFDTSYIGDSLFSNDQRIRQYLNYPNFGDGESYGGVAFDCSSSNCIDRDIEDAPVAGGNATKSYSSWTVQMFDYSSYNPPPGDTVLYGIDDDFMGQPNSTGSPGDMTGIEAPNSGNATNEGFFWCCTSGNFTLLNGFFSGAETKPFGLNNMDVVAGYYYPPTQVQGFLFNWVSSTAMTIDAPSAYGTFPRGINDNGDVVGSWADSSGSTHGFIAVSPYGESNWTSLDYSRGGTTYFVGVNGQGEVSGYYVDSKNASHGFVYSQSHGWTHIDICSGAGGRAVLGINNNGQVVGYCPNETAPSAFLYDIAHGSWIPITTPPGPYCTPGQTWGVNDSNMADGLVLNCEGNDLSDGFYSTPNP